MDNQEQGSSKHSESFRVWSNPCLFHHEHAKDKRESEKNQKQEHKH